MSPTTDLVAELVRPANEAEKLRKYERRDLLVRAVTPIRDMAATVDRPVARASTEEIVDLQVQDASIGERANPPEEAREALHLTARRVRELHIILEIGAETDISRTNR